ncbi:hypothetical protein [Dysgonomonas massiliensis]|uniref:hypothetical protein n=1 Tax=Dysgonomonas massiliensis TaxID=2040292 RepID=UPI0011AF5E5A|nr:hypothetical protein [Dysgonomonas massiliensis]
MGIISLLQIKYYNKNCKTKATLASVVVVTISSLGTWGQLGLLVSPNGKINMSMEHFVSETFPSVFYR